eukprot:SAG11_NODE_585_length_8349_cov_38.121939_9_plen_193_part_00
MILSRLHLSPICLSTKSLKRVEILRVALTLKTGIREQLEANKSLPDIQQGNRRHAHHKRARAALVALIIRLWTVPFLSRLPRFSCSLNHPPFFVYLFGLHYLARLKFTDYVAESECLGTPEEERTSNDAGNKIYNVGNVLNTDDWHEARDVLYKDFCHSDDTENTVPSCWITQDMASYDSEYAANRIYDCPD